MSKKLTPSLITAIVATGLLSFCGVVVETATNIAFPVIMRTFQVDTATVQWLTTAYLLIAAIMMPLSAYLKNSFRNITLFGAAAGLFMLGLLIDWLAPQFIWLVVGRVIQGLAAGLALPLMFNLILEQAPTDRIGLLMGLGTLVTAIAPAVGPTFGGIVISALGWRAIFGLLMPLVLLAFLLGIFTIKQVSTPTHPQLDWLGFGVISVTLIGLILACSNLALIVKKPLAFWVPLLIGIIALAYFIHHSLHQTQPLLNLQTLKNSAFTANLGAFALVQVAALGMSFVLPNYIQLVNHQSALIAGLLVLPGAALGAVFAPIGGSLLDRFGARRPIILGACCEILAMALFVVLARHLTNPLIAIFYVLFMLGMGLVMGNTMTNGLTKLPANWQTDGNGLFNLVQQFAGAVGTACVSAIMQLVQTSHLAATYENRTALGAQLAFVTLLVLIVVALLALLKGTKQQNKQA